MSIVKIGVVAKDTITGFSGLVVAYATHLSNCDRALLSPRELKDDGQPRETCWFDVPQLKYVEDTDVPVIEPVKTDIKNGDKATHIMNGFTGTVIGINTWINGCVRIGIHSHEMIKGSPLEDLWFPCQELAIIKQQSIEEPINKVGGPMKAPKSMSVPK